MLWRNHAPYICSLTAYLPPCNHSYQRCILLGPFTPSQGPLFTKTSVSTPSTSVSTFSFCEPSVVSSVQFSVFLFAIVKYNINYNNNRTLGRQSKKQYAYLKDCFKKWSKKLECKLSLAEQKYEMKRPQK